ncbi:hypothetical protein ABIE56_002398 [Luteibacter sp. 621]|uniref:hypothetical protein n=1 Tax=Luteibacter sp. 621 TaxID=3373916 RepID=UPI003D1DC1A6
MLAALMPRTPAGHAPPCRGDRQKSDHDAAIDQVHFLPKQIASLTERSRKDRKIHRIVLVRDSSEERSQRLVRGLESCNSPVHHRTCVGKASQDDPTIRKCIGFDIREGCSGNAVVLPEGWVIPEGWHLVPETPTERMLDEGWPPPEFCEFDKKGSYADLVALVPRPPAAIGPNPEVVAHRTRSKSHPRYIGNWIDGDMSREHEAEEAPFNTVERAVLAPAAMLRHRIPSFQARVSWWMDQCFLPSLYSDMTERGDRLLEEVLELLQAHGYDQARVPTLVDYVFKRPVGEPAQEVGGVMVTLAGFCWIARLDMHAAGEAELARINQPEVMANIRAKQEAKNALHFDTPLPGARTQAPHA